MTPYNIHISKKVLLKFDEKGLVDEFSNEILDETFIDFIRKDVLLEWARERLDFACALKSEGQKTVCKELIDKIESL